MTIHLPVPRWIVDIETLGGDLNNVGERGIDQPRFILSVSSLSIIIASQNAALDCVQIQAGNKILRFIRRIGGLIMFYLNKYIRLFSNFVVLN